MTTQVEMLGFIVREPMTTFTDYVVGAVAIWFAVQLIFSDDHRQHQSRRLWGVAFAFIGAGAMLGGTSHGFADYFSDAAMTLIWTCTLLAIGMSMAFAVAGTIQPSVSRRTWRLLLHSANLSVFLLFAIRVLHDNSYLSAIVMTVCSLGAIALLQGANWIIKRTASAKWIVSGIVVSFIAAAVQRSGMDLHAHFNHNDLYHTIQLLGLYLLHRGAALLVAPDPLSMDGGE